jgi:hypothetical protein
MSGLESEHLGEAPWKLTTTAIWCPDVAQRAVLIVKGDWRSYCCWHLQRQAAGVDAASCQGAQCLHVRDYRRSLIEEETAE